MFTFYAVDPDFLYMDDNAYLNKITELSDTLGSKSTKCMEWPAYSPILNSIEHVLHVLFRYLIHPFQIVEELKTVLRERGVGQYLLRTPQWFSIQLE